VGDDKSLMVPDIQRDPRFADNETIKQWGVRFYAGAPLRVADGLVIGALCILGPEPRTLKDEEVALLETMAADVAAAIAPGNANEGSTKAAPSGSSATIGQKVPETN
jgi:GAF domain-containing protein